MLPRMALKEYAPASRGTPTPEHEFAMVFLRDGTEERHEFAARPRMGWQDVQGLMPLLAATSPDGKGVDPRALRSVDRLIRRALVNDDGTPEKWAPAIVDGHFSDPNGDHAPQELLPAYEAFDAGSSRRRWAYLMDVDDELTVEPEQIMQLMSDLIEVASDRPLSRSEPSTG